MGFKNLNLIFTLTHKGYSATFDLEVFTRLATTVIIKVISMTPKENCVEICGTSIPNNL